MMVSKVAYGAKAQPEAPCCLAAAGPTTYLHQLDGPVSALSVSIMQDTIDKMG